MATKKVRILARVGDPSSGVILQPGAVIDLPEVWADRYIASGSAEPSVKAAKAEEKADMPKGKKGK